MTKVKLISHTKAVDSDRNLQELIAFCARVSNPTNQNNDASSEKLVNYLINHKHWSPFEMVSACVEAETTRDIGRQLIRHNGLKFQEFSGRYANAVDSLGFTIREARLQDPTNRQNSIEVDDENLQEEWESIQLEVIRAAESAYLWAVDKGIAKEQARVVLPEGLIKSRFYIHGYLRSWIHYIAVRTGKDVQKEHRELALGCAEALEPIFPMIMTFIQK
jgi:thymidylate synthase (FAD)